MRNPIRTFCLVLLCSLAAAGVLLSQAASPPANSAIQPAPREGAPYERYLKLNDIVQKNQGPLDLAFVGDSITQGWEGNGKEVWQKYYGTRKAINLGISGDRTQHVLWRLDNGHANGIRPQVTVLMIGTNNSADDRNTAPEMVEGVTAVVRKIREKMPETQILLLGIFPRGEEFNAQRGKILQVNQVIRKLEDGRSIHYLDIGHLFLSADGRIAKEIMPDFLHLTPQGYEIWAEAIEPKLKELLAAGKSTSLGNGPGGEWILDLRPPSGEAMELLLTIKVDGERVTGSLQSPDGRGLEIESGEFKGGQLRFTVRRVRSSGAVNTYEVQGTVQADSMKGTVNALSEGQTIEWSARRKK